MELSMAAEILIAFKSTITMLCTMKLLAGGIPLLRSRKSIDSTRLSKQTVDILYTFWKRMGANVKIVTLRYDSFINTLSVNN
ncbi:hypothetical protein BLOT_010690 [Blomia tropicalis]|nr:hypothetical protein BLOT_010690 [Blomia tropicalis]